MTDPKPLTANSTIGEWLDHPKGGPLIRGLLAQAGVDEAMLAPVRGLPLQQLVAMSQGQLPQPLVDDLVLQANGGEIPDESAVDDDGVAREDHARPVRRPDRDRHRRRVRNRPGHRVPHGPRGRPRDRRRHLRRASSTSSRRPCPDADIITVAGDITKQDGDRRASSPPPATASTPSRTSPASTTTSRPRTRRRDAVWDRVIAINLTGGVQAHPRGAARRCWPPAAARSSTSPREAGAARQRLGQRLHGLASTA